MAVYASVVFTVLVSQHSSWFLWCLLSWVDCVNVLLHFRHLKGFSPVCVLIWLLSVVAPANDLLQNPHLNGFSLIWVTTWSRSSLASWKLVGQWPQWYGLSGVCAHMCIWRRTRWLNVWLHWPHRQILGSTLASVSSIGNIPLCCPRLSKPFSCDKQKIE